MKKMELLAPAGSPEALRTAVLYGADAVYVGGEAYGLRARAKNFTKEQLEEGIRFAHNAGVKVYVAVNIIAHNEHLEGLADYLRDLQEVGADALIMADAGMIRVARRVVPEMEIHLSTQASATNYETFAFWAEQGVKRIVAAREISLEEMKQIRAEIPEQVEIEAFGHGAMCISISGRCLLSNYLADRASNLGECTHPCRWQYVLMEKSRTGEYFPVEEGVEGTYIFNSKDLCMVEYLPEMIEAGISSLKLEGRMKTPLYTAMVTKVYREALDDLARDPEVYQAKKQYYLHMLSLVSHRGYTTGFYLGKPGPAEQVYDSADYIKEVEFVAKTLPEYESGQQKLEQRGKFSIGETVYILSPRGEMQPIFVEKIINEAGESVESAPHAQQKIWLSMPEQSADTILVKYKG